LEPTHGGCYGEITEDAARPLRARAGLDWRAHGRRPLAHGRTFGFGREGSLAAAADFASETGLPGQRSEIKLQA